MIRVGETLEGEGQDPAGGPLHDAERPAPDRLPAHPVLADEPAGVEFLQVPAPAVGGRRRADDLSRDALRLVAGDHCRTAFPSAVK
jgi:hypothetical protein